MAESIFDRIVQGVRYVVQGVEPGSWMSPGQPVLPVAQEEARGRLFDFPVGTNYTYTPRSTEAISFATMRGLADGYDLLRLIIETRKDQLSKFNWKVGPIDPEREEDERCRKLRDFLRYPDREHPWDIWVRALVEEMLVIDAATVYPRKTFGGELYSLDIIDGATIKRIVDATGRTPIAPSPAYQQVIKGMAAVDYSADELVYRPRNYRVNKFYGYSPVEQVIATVNIALQRQASQLSYYADGSTPDLIFQCPETWNPDQIREFKTYWDMMLKGNVQERRGTMFVPSGTAPVNVKEAMLKDEYDEWLARIVCFAFSIAPTPFVKQMNRATAETIQQQALNEGVAPLQKWIKDTLDYIIQRHAGYADLEFQWDEEDAIDPFVQAQIAGIYLDKGVVTDDEVRENLGLDPLTPEQREQMKANQPQPMGFDEDGNPIPAQGNSAVGSPKGKPGGEEGSPDENEADKRKPKSQTDVTKGAQKKSLRRLTAIGAPLAKSASAWRKY